MTTMQREYFSFPLSVLQTVVTITSENDQITLHTTTISESKDQGYPTPCKNWFPGIIYFLCSLLESSDAEMRVGIVTIIALPQNRKLLIPVKETTVGSRDTGKHLINGATKQLPKWLEVMSSQCTSKPLWLHYPTLLPQETTSLSHRGALRQLCSHHSCTCAPKELSSVFLKHTHKALPQCNYDPFFHLFYVY